MPEVRQSSFALLGDLTKVNKHVYNLYNKSFDSSRNSLNPELRLNLYKKLENKIHESTILFELRSHVVNMQGGQNVRIVRIDFF